MHTKIAVAPSGHVDSRYRAAADLLDGYVHESHFKHTDQSPDHTIVWASEGFSAVYGCTVEEYNHSGIWGGLYHPEDREAALQRAAALRRGDTVEAETRITGRGGQTRWLYVKNKPILDPGTGRVIGVLGVGQDITRRKLAEETLRTHAVILDTLNEGVIMFDAAGAIHYSNRAADRMFAMELRSLLGESISRFGIRHRIAARHGRDDRPVGDLHHVESVCRRPDGTEFLAKLTFSQVLLHDKTMAIAVLHDATAEAQLEREIIDVASREQQRIAVELQDGLGQELTGVALMLRSLTETNAPLSPPLGAVVEEIIGLVNRAITETRMLARGLSPVELERGGLSFALDALAARTRDAFDVEVAFSSRIGPGAATPAPVADHLYRIAQEAVSNAIRHSGARSVRISLIDRGGALELTVADDGRGIGNDVLPRDGMGLRLMEYRARMIGAQVTFNSRDGRGTKVLCRLPRIRA